MFLVWWQLFKWCFKVIGWGDRSVNCFLINPNSVLWSISLKKKIVVNINEKGRTQEIWRLDNLRKRVVRFVWFIVDLKCYSLTVVPVWSLSGMYEIPGVNSISHMKDRVYWGTLCGWFPPVHVCFQWVNPLMHNQKLLMKWYLSLL